MDYIDREKLLEELRAESDLNNGDDLKEIQILSIVGKAPTEDVAPIRHGKWKYDSSYDVCSLCGFVNGFDEEFTYCPGCGAIMDGKEN